ncbi:hypothetical protein ACWKWU_21660 [Chitinophaga lutea]
MRISWILMAVIALLAVLFGVKSCADQRRAATLLKENERLLRQVRDLQHSLSMASSNAQQIAGRGEMRAEAQAQFIDRREYFRRNWKQYISVNTGDYRTGFLGGIRDLEVTVRNQTEYPIDNAVVEVQYLRGNGNVFKTDRYTVHNIAEKGAQSVPAAASRKGTKVRIELVSVTSQAMNFCWSRDKRPALNDPDPWACVPKAPVNPK